MPHSSFLDDWIRRIRSADAMTFEDAYFGTRPSGDEVVPRLIQELLASPDAYTRGKFCELLGEMGDNSAIPVLTDELSHPDQGVRNWAALALEELQSPERRAEKQLHLSHFRVDDGYQS